LGENTIQYVKHKVVTETKWKYERKEVKEEYQLFNQVCVQKVATETEHRNAKD